MSKRGSDRRRKASLLVRGLPRGTTEGQSLGDPQAMAPKVPQQFPTEGQGSSGVPPPTPTLTSGGSLLGSALPGTSGREWQYPTSMYRNCLQEPWGWIMGMWVPLAASATPNHLVSVIGPALTGIQGHSRHSIILVE